MTKLTTAEINDAIDSLPGWRIAEAKLHREFRFGDFPRAIGFMVSVSIHAEVMNHHPEWFNVYDTVRVWLVTHDVGGISQKDLDLARRMDELYGAA